MGVDAADFDEDGNMDVALANFSGEEFSLYHNDGHELFSDWANQTPIGEATRMLSGWGTKLFDYDNDGNLDLIFASGHPDPDIDRASQYAYLEPLLLFRNTGRGFVNVSPDGGDAFQQHWAARGLAVGDFDNDGAQDVLVGINGGAPLLLRNQAAAGAATGMRWEQPSNGPTAESFDRDIKSAAAASAPPMILVWCWDWVKARPPIGWR
ncbi:MAG: hypothetical protein DMG26_07925 [Acidobacteria bacterium]|nr:MAG: hypothetical protein DMG26_07925 [Acidobacteriota bacterium]